MRLNSALLMLMAAVPVLAGLRTDVEFARVGGEPLLLDAFTPEGPGPFPTAIIVHGGGFVRGDKQTYVKPLFEPLSRAGYAWFSINYRLAPAHRFPAPAEDVAAALGWVHAHAKEYKVDRKHIALIGESAGGYLVSYAGVRGPKDAPVAAVVSFYGPHDLVARVHEEGKVSEGFQALLGVTDPHDPLLQTASPVTYVRKTMPPYLLIHGTADTQVPYEQSVLMCERMKAAGAACELYTVQGGGHGMGSWEKDPALQGYKSKLIQWLNATLH